MTQARQSDLLRREPGTDSAVPAPEETEQPSPTIVLLLAGSLCSLPFLLPYNKIFQEEWLAGALGVAAVLAALAKRRGPVCLLPVPARWLLAFALFLAGQSLIVHPVYPQVPVLAVLYVLYAALLIWLGAQVAASGGIERAATVLAACLLAGALVNAAFGIIQTYGRPAILDDFIADLPYGASAWGNLSQQNLYANYLALGATALMFLWARGSMHTGYAITAAISLAWACALSGSRASLLYAVWFVLVGAIAGGMQSGSRGRRLRSAAYAMAGAILLAHVAVPAIDAALELSNVGKGALDRLSPTSAINYQPRWQIWGMAWQLFASAPLSGVGIGGFAGGAFEYGLAPSLTQFGNQVWTSPHNLPLQLLAETGAIGAFLALASLCAWCVKISRRYVGKPHPAVWWTIAAVGIELIHSMVEYPLWSAHFLGVTALLIGLGMQPGFAAGIGATVTRGAAVAASAALVVLLAMALRDYVRFSTTQVTGSAVTLADPATGERDAATLRAVTHGPLGPPAEYWTILGAPLDRRQLSDRLAMSERIARHYPAHAIVVRRAVFLAFDGQAAKARRVLAQAIYTFPKRCQETVRILTQAFPTDQAAIQPLLALTNTGKGCV